MGTLRMSLIVLAICAVVMALASCGGGGQDVAATVSAPEVAPAPTATVAPVDWPDNYLAPDVAAKYPGVAKDTPMPSDGIPECSR